MYSQDRESMRRYFLDAWRRAIEGQPLEPLEAQIAQVVRAHPEYHGLLENPDAALSRDFLPESGETNPFLHLGLHLAILEQIGTDRPAGIRSACQRLMGSSGDVHAAEHEIMECLAQSLWEAQRMGRAPDEGAYLACVEALLPPPKPRA
jgi:hypothetical protein